MKGNQNYDVEIENHVLHYLEIATAEYDDGEKFRMREFLRNGSVDMFGRIQRNCRGKPVDIENRGEARRSRDLLKEQLECIEKRIDAKSKKHYPDKTGLVIYFDDYKKNLDGLQELISRTKPRWSNKFSCVLLVGPRACECCEEWK